LRNFTVISQRDFKDFDFVWDYTVQVKPSDQKSKQLFRHWCKRMFSYLEDNYGHCGQAWTSRKCKYTNTLHIKFRETDHAAMFLLAHK
jgi:outer membrane receptor for Fe3+-dicitrate